MRTNRTYCQQCDLDDVKRVRVRAGTSVRRVIGLCLLIPALLGLLISAGGYLVGEHLMEDGAKTPAEWTASEIQDLGVPEEAANRLVAHPEEREELLERYVHPDDRPEARSILEKPKPLIVVIFLNIILTMIGAQWAWLAGSAFVICLIVTPIGWLLARHGRLWACALCGTPVGHPGGKR